MSLPETTKSNWIEDVRAAYDSGASDAEVCKIMQITQDEFVANYESNPKFRRFVDLGTMMAKAWWLEQGRKNLSSRSFNTPLWIINMKNRFGWTEKVETVELAGNLDEKSKAELEQKFNKILESLIGTKGDGASMRTLLALPTPGSTN